MSMAIQRAKYTGDPFLGGLVGAGVSWLGKKLLGGSRQPAAPQAGPGGVMPYAGFQQMPPPMMAQRTPGFTGMMQRTFPGGASGYQCPTSGPPGPGYRLNKSDYFLRDGTFVPKGSRWVKIRRRNPANARATSRAISRVKSAKKYAKSLSSVTIREKR